jgi:hypothetical protein
LGGGIGRVVLQSTEAGYALYHRMGFREATRYSVYLTKQQRDGRMVSAGLGAL